MKEFIKGSYGERYTNPKLRPKQTMNELKELRDAYGVAMQEINKLRKEIKQLKKKRSEMND